MPGPPVGQNKRLTPHQPKPRDDGGKLIDLARAAYGGWSDIEHRRNVQMHAQIQKSKDKPDIFEKAGSYIYGFVKSTINNDIKDAKRIYKGMPGYAKDRLWAMVPYHFLPEDRKRKLDSQPQIAADWKGGFLKALLDDIMNEGAANIYAKTGAKFKNASLDTPFSKIFQATAKKVPGPGRVLKVGGDETDSFGIAWGGRGTGWPNEDPTYLRRPWVTLPEKGGYTLVLPKGAEHFEAGQYAKDVWGTDVYNYAAPGKVRVEYDRMGNRITNGTLPQHGWLYRDTPTSMNLETGITDSGKGADSIYNLVKTILENGEDFGDVEAAAGYWNRYNNYEAYVPPSAQNPEWTPSSYSSIRQPYDTDEAMVSRALDRYRMGPSSLTNEAIDEYALGSPNRGPVVTPNGANADFVQWLRANRPPAIVDEILQVLGEPMAEGWTPQQVIQAQGALRGIQSPNAAQNSFLRWLDNLQFGTPVPYNMPMDQYGPIRPFGVPSNFAVESGPGSYGYTSAHFNPQYWLPQNRLPWWQQSDWLNK